MSPSVENGMFAEGAVKNVDAQHGTLEVLMQVSLR
jgi:hypothetical protein